MPTDNLIRFTSAMGIFQEYYQSNQLHSYSASSISWILSLEPFVLFAAGIVIGRVNLALSTLGGIHTNLLSFRYSIIMARDGFFLSGHVFTSLVL
jgi:hypothetical protein